MNQDVQLRIDCIDKALAFMDSHPRCAIAGMKQLDSENPDRITHGGTGDVYPGVHLTGLVSRGDCAVNLPMKWVNGASLIVRLSAIKDIGLMDERFFLYCSDSDWCLTATLLKAWEVWYCADAVCLHSTHGCSQEPTPEQAEILRRDHAAFVEKWFPILDPPPPTANKW